MRSSPTPASSRRGCPAITYGLKGLAYFELVIEGANRDLHSGTYGGAVANPLNALATILASLKGPDGKIKIAGFYDSVRPLADWERAEFAKLPFSEAEFQADLGVSSLEGEAGYTTLERKWARPTCDINGLFGGYAGPGPKTVLPCKAGAKLSFRLVPNQDPKTVDQQFRDHVAKVCPPGVTYKVITHHGAPAVLVNVDTPGVHAAAQGHRGRLRHQARLHARRGLDPRGGIDQGTTGRRHPASGLGPDRRQPARPEREILPGRLSSRDQGQRPSAGRSWPGNRWLEVGSVMEVPCSILKFVVANAEAVRQNCRNRNVPADVLEDLDRAVGLETERRALLREVEEIRRRQNEVAQSTGRERDPRNGLRLIEEGKRLKTEVADQEERLRRLDAEITQRLRRVPNLTHPDAPIGLTEDDSREIRKVGTPRAFDFKPKDHVELGKALDLIDFETGGKVAGTGFYFLKNDAVLLDLALQTFALGKLIDAGFTPIITPDLARNQILEGIGFTPRGVETQVYSIEDTDLSLVGTAEITLGGMHADEVVDESELPIKYVGLSHCFRTEAGAAGGPAGASTASTSSPRSKCSPSRLPKPRARSTPRCSRSRKTCSGRWAFPTACSTSARETWGARRIASSTWKPGCPAAATTASTAK